MTTLILGGARSGKSALAEKMAAATGRGVVYLATAAADPGDVDMAERVRRHRIRRPLGWSTVECGPGLVAAVRGAEPSACLLIDSLGSWLAATGEADIDASGLCSALCERPGPNLVVSEEVGLGVHPSSAAGREFRDRLGTLNQLVAGVAERVLLVVAGRVLDLA
ncbi:MAG: bifunctional adenosylcobinamide kinase/adenosylcobinamide-phosphate guanylyltransferase [Acidimicrobiales bacterium]